MLIAATTSPARADETPPTPGRKSGYVATGLAVGGLVACIAGVEAKFRLYRADQPVFGRITEVGTVFVCVLGPSTGQWYTDSPWRVAIASGLRAGGVILGSIGHAVDDQGASDSFVITGGMMFMGALVYDLAAAPFAARRYNRRFDAMTLTPAPMTSPGGAPAAGLFVVGSF